MEIFSEINEKCNLSLALGFFDGVHKGHQAVIKKAVDYAKHNDTKSAVVTFKEHPILFLSGVSPEYILTKDERRVQIEKLGVDYLYELDFSKISNLSAEDYLKNILLKYFRPIAITTGFNHHFGAGKIGDANFLKQKSYTYNYSYFMQEAEYDNFDIISSTSIRSFLAEGNLNKANSMLGYIYPITGTVVRGEQIGRKLGFRTANLLYPEGLIQLPYGAYATLVSVKKSKYLGVTNIGIRPTVSNKNFCTIETHIQDFNKNIYGDEIRLEFLERLRPEIKFSSIEDLKKQIKIDINKSQLIFKNFCNK